MPHAAPLLSSPLAAVVHNPITHHFQYTVLHTIKLLDDARTSGKNRRSAGNATCFLGLVIKQVAETGSFETFKHMFEMLPSMPLQEAMPGGAPPPIVIITNVDNNE